VRLGVYLANDVGLKYSPEGFDCLSSSAALVIAASPAALKQEGREIGDLDSWRVVAVHDARSLDDARSGPTDKFPPVMGMNGFDQSPVRASSLVEDQQAPIAEPLALPLQAGQQLVDRPHSGHTQIASGIPRPLDGYEGDLAVAKLNRFEAQLVGTLSAGWSRRAFQARRE
jgi:hypothetical protein